MDREIKVGIWLAGLYIDIFLEERRFLVILGCEVKLVGKSRKKNSERKGLVLEEGGGEGGEGVVGG